MIYKKRLFIFLSLVFIFSSFINALDDTDRPYTSIGGISVPETQWAQDAIKAYVDAYTKNFGKKQLCTILDNGEIYRLYIRQELKKRNMPPALEYLPFVESEYIPVAKSKSGALGLWQFMDNSMAPFLKKTEWVDERCDPWKSTDAALTKLQDNYKMFKDWPLAIAAYNCGAGAMKRILKKSPEKSFWYIAERGLLRDQSVQYVPKLLAITELTQNCMDYDIEIPELSQSGRFADFDYLTTTKSINLTSLASELRIEYDSLRLLNTALLHNCTPPDTPYQLRLPSGLKESAQIAVNDIISKNRLTDTVPYKIKKGDTLYSLAKKNGCTVNDICLINNILKDTPLSVGKILYIPHKNSR